MAKGLDENRAIVMEYLRNDTVIPDADPAFISSDKPFEKMSWVFTGRIQFIEYPFCCGIVQLFKLGQRFF